MNANAAPGAQTAAPAETLCPTRPDLTTQPAWTAAIAAIFSVGAIPAATARVLELGCGTGDNIVALAARFPQAQFTGIDISEPAIAAGTARIAALNLRNIELRTMNILDFAAGEFDYMIADTVFSYVTRDVQDAIFRIMRDHLSDRGLCTMQYNVLPGASLRTPVRDLMQFHTAKIADPALKKRAAKDVVRMIASASPGAANGTFTHHHEALRRGDDCALLQELLGPVNDASYFTEIADRADSYGLAYVSEAVPWYAFSDAFPAHVFAELAQTIGDDPIAAEQYIDYLTTRRFRTSIFAKRANAVSRRLEVTREKVGGLYFTPMAPVFAIPGGRAPADTPTVAMSAGFAGFTCGGEMFSAPTELRKDIFRYIADHCNGTGRSVSVAQIAAAVAAPDAPGAAEVDEAAEVIFDFLRRGLVYMSSENPGAGPAGDRPRVFAVAIADARSGAPYTENLMHDVVPLNDSERNLFMPLCDGTRSTAEIGAAFIELLRAGQVQLVRDGRAIAHDDAAPEAEANAWIHRQLAWLTDQKLLHAD